MDDSGTSPPVHRDVHRRAPLPPQVAPSGLPQAFDTGAGRRRLAVKSVSPTLPIRLLHPRATPPPQTWRRSGPPRSRAVRRRSKPSTSTTDPLGGGEGPRAADRHRAGRRLVLVAERRHLRSRRSVISRAWTRIRRAKPRTMAQHDAARQPSKPCGSGIRNRGAASRKMRPLLSHRHRRLTRIYGRAEIAGPFAIPALSARGLFGGDSDDRTTTGTGGRLGGRQS